MPLKVQKRMSLTTNTIEENRLVSPRRDSLEKYRAGDAEGERFEKKACAAQCANHDCFRVIHADLNRQKKPQDLQRIGGRKLCVNVLKPHH